MLKSRGSVHWPLLPQSGHTISVMGTDSGVIVRPFFASFSL
ncbi:Uncharacterised protein [Mycobacteroides abscessus subsp. abscessus]|nr:Uncharacterised protein [Mycobacteroides abscessus subsp. abscessus]